MPALLAKAPDTSSEKRRWRLLRYRPEVAPALAALLGAVAFVTARLLILGHGDISVFVDAGPFFTDPHPHLLLQRDPGFGFDGQFSYRLALDPSDLQPYGHGVRLDSALREQRILYPTLVWLVSLGGKAYLVPTALVVVNVFAVVAIAAAGGRLAREAGRRPIWGLLLAAPWCYLLTIGRDLHEAVAGAFLAWAIVALRRQRRVVAAGLLTCGVLTRESVLIFALTVFSVDAVHVWRRHARPEAGDLIGLLPISVFVSWQIVCWRANGAFPAQSGSGANFGVPAEGLAQAVTKWFSTSGLAVDRGAQFLLLVVLTLSVVPLLRRTSIASTYERTAWVAYVGYVLCQSMIVWYDAGELRATSDLQLLSAVFALSGPSRQRRGYAGLAALGWMMTAVRRASQV